MTSRILKATEGFKWCCKFCNETFHSKQLAWKHSKDEHEDEVLVLKEVKKNGLVGYS